MWNHLVMELYFVDLCKEAALPSSLYNENLEVVYGKHSVAYSNKYSVLVVGSGNKISVISTNELGFGVNTDIDLVRESDDDETR